MICFWVFVLALVANFDGVESSYTCYLKPLMEDHGNNAESPLEVTADLMSCTGGKVWTPSLHDTTLHFELENEDGVSQSGPVHLRVAELHQVGLVTIGAGVSLTVTRELDGIQSSRKRGYPLRNIFVYGELIFAPILVGEAAHVILRAVAITAKAADAEGENEIMGRVVLANGAELHLRDESTLSIAGELAVPTKGANAVVALYHEIEDYDVVTFHPTSRLTLADGASLRFANQPPGVPASGAAVLRPFEPEQADDWRARVVFREESRADVGAHGSLTIHARLAMRGTVELAQSASLTLPPTPGGDDALDAGEYVGDETARVFLSPGVTRFGEPFGLRAPLRVGERSELLLCGGFKFRSPVALLGGARVASLDDYEQAEVEFKARVDVLAPRPGTRKRLDPVARAPPVALHGVSASLYDVGVIAAGATLQLAHDAALHVFGALKNVDGGLLELLEPALCKVYGAGARFELAGAVAGDGAGRVEVRESARWTVYESSVLRDVRCVVKRGALHLAPHALLLADGSTSLEFVEGGQLVTECADGDEQSRGALAFDGDAQISFEPGTGVVGVPAQRGAAPALEFDADKLNVTEACVDSARQSTATTATPAQGQGSTLGAEPGGANVRGSTMMADEEDGDNSSGGVRMTSSDIAILAGVIVGVLCIIGVTVFVVRRMRAGGGRAERDQSQAMRKGSFISDTGNYGQVPPMQNERAGIDGQYVGMEGAAAPQKPRMTELFNEYQQIDMQDGNAYDQVPPEAGSGYDQVPQNQYDRAPSTSAYGLPPPLNGNGQSSAYGFGQLAT